MALLEEEMARWPAPTYCAPDIVDTCSNSDKKTFHNSDLELDLGVSVSQLSDSAAKHKMAVKPKRLRGIPSRRWLQQLAAGSRVTSAPEINEEDSGSSSNPNVKSSGQEFIATDELNTTVALNDTDQVTACPSAHPATNLLLAETQLKPASLPPESALTPEVQNSETPIVAKEKRWKFDVAVQQFQPSISDEYSHSASVTDMVVYQHHTKIVSETDISEDLSEFAVSECSEIHKSVCEIVGEEEGEADVDDNMLNRERKRDDKGKDDSSFLSRIFRSGKKKMKMKNMNKNRKNFPQEAECTSCSTVYSSTPRMIPKHIDQNGSYACETMNDYTVNLPSLQTKQHKGKIGGTRSTSASRKTVKSNIQISQEGPHKAETDRKVEEVTVGMPVKSSLPPEAIEIETDKKYQQLSPRGDEMESSHMSNIRRMSVAKKRFIDFISVVMGKRNNNENVAKGISFRPALDYM
jgi:hypothetical protein